MKQEAFFGCLFNGYQEVKTIDFVGGYKASRIIGSVRLPCQFDANGLQLMQQIKKMNQFQKDL